MSESSRLFTSRSASVVAIDDRLRGPATLLGGARSFEGFSTYPSREQLATFLETAFWASLKTDEGRPTRFAATLTLRDQMYSPLVLSERLAFTEREIAKIAPALPPEGCLGVAWFTSGFAIWGFSRNCPNPFGSSVTVRVSEPGVLRVDVGMFQPFAVLDGRADPILADRDLGLRTALARALRRQEPPDDHALQRRTMQIECDALADLTRLVLREGHGGTLLMVPDESEDWERSLEFAYRFATPDSRIHDTIREELQYQISHFERLGRWLDLELPQDVKNAGLALTSSTPIWSVDVTEIIRSMAALASVDGAVVLTKELRCLGCGAKILVGPNAIGSVRIFQPVPGVQETELSPLERLGGTRHQSAARFVGAHHDTVAVVISEDRHLSLMYWEPEVDAVAVTRNAEWWV